jgi:hypothetical protein
MINPLDYVFDLIDKRSIIRRGVLGTTLWMTWKSFTWAAAYAIDSARPGADVAMIIAAVLAPISLLQGHAFRAYIDSRAE